MVPVPVVPGARGTLAVCLVNSFPFNICVRVCVALSSVSDVSGLLGGSMRGEGYCTVAAHPTQRLSSTHGSDHDAATEPVRERKEVVTTVRVARPIAVQLAPQSQAGLMSQTPRDRVDKKKSACAEYA